MAEVLATFQRIAERRAEQAAHRWTRLPFREIAGTRWLIVGFGAIGQAWPSGRGRSGPRSSACAAAAPPHPWPSTHGAALRREPLLPAADVVVLATPLNTETRGMADAGFFAAMKPGSVLVNVGRGDLVDEPALLAALAGGVPEHAMLDVFHDRAAEGRQPVLGPSAGQPDAARLGVRLRPGGAQRRSLRGKPAPPLAGEPLLYEADPRDLGR